MRRCLTALAFVATIILVVVATVAVYHQHVSENELHEQNRILRQRSELAVEYAELKKQVTNGQRQLWQMYRCSESIDEFSSMVSGTEVLSVWSTAGRNDRFDSARYIYLPDGKFKLCYATNSFWGEYSRSKIDAYCTRTMAESDSDFVDVEGPAVVQWNFPPYSNRKPAAKFAIQLVVEGHQPQNLPLDWTGVAGTLPGADLFHDKPGALQPTYGTQMYVARHTVYRSPPIARRDFQLKRQTADGKQEKGNGVWLCWITSATARVSVRYVADTLVRNPQAVFPFKRDQHGFFESGLN